MAIRKVFLAAALGLVVGSTASAAMYEVKIENLIPGGFEMGQALTPPVVVVHGAGYALYSAGEYASAGLEMLAEDGVTADLVAEAMASPHVVDVEVGGGPFFDMVTVQVEGMPGDLVSVATMLARSNDLFTGVSGVALPAGGSIVIDPTGVYDAGTEVNTGLVEHIPFYGNAFVGPEENGMVGMVMSYEVMNDPMHKTLRYEFPPAARITITSLDPTPAEQQTWGGIKELFR